jgi:hypothetical protein
MLLKEFSLRQDFGQQTLFNILMSPVKVPYERPIWVDTDAALLADQLEDETVSVDAIASVLDGWSLSHPKSSPPLLLHLTDPETTHEVTQCLLGLQGTRGGLLFNFILENASEALDVLPSVDQNPPPAPAMRMLWDSASEVPESFAERLQSLLRRPLPHRSKAFASVPNGTNLNWILDKVLAIFTWGTLGDDPKVKAARRQEGIEAAYKQRAEERAEASEQRAIVAEKRAGRAQFLSYLAFGLAVLSLVVSTLQLLFKLSGLI